MDENVPNYTSGNPWENPLIGGPNRGAAITGIDWLDGMLRGWMTVETFKGVRDLQQANIRQQIERGTVERPQQAGQVPQQPTPPAPASSGGIALDGKTLGLLALGLAAFLVLK